MSILKKKSEKEIVKVSEPKRRSVPALQLVPLVSEKSTRLQSLGQYSFKVAPNISKVEVKKAIEASYGVRVIGINSVLLPRKEVRRGRVVGHTNLRHRMIVRLAPGQSLDLTKAV